MRNAAVTACRGFDFVLSPVAPMAAFAAELASPTHDPARPFEHIGFTVPFNMSEQPAASINAGYTSGGLPIGLQIVGRRFDDLGVLRLSRAYEAHAAGAKALAAARRLISARRAGSDRGRRAGRRREG